MSTFWKDEYSYSYSYSYLFSLDTFCRDENDESGQVESEQPCHHFLPSVLTSPETKMVLTNRIFSPETKILLTNCIFSPETKNTMTNCLFSHIITFQFCVVHGFDQIGVDLRCIQIPRTICRCLPKLIRAQVFTCSVYFLKSNLNRLC